MNQEIGIGLKVGATLCATLMIASVKALGGAIPTGEVVFFRSAFALVPLGIWLAVQGDIVAMVRTRHLGGHLIRGISGTGGMFFSYLAVVYLPLADAVALGYAAPLITVVLAAILLKEKIRIYRWSAVVAGLVGVLVMLSPNLMKDRSAGDLGSTLLIGTAFGLTAAMFSALSSVQIRHLASTEKPGAIVLYFSLMTTVIGLSTAAFGWTPPSLTQTALLVASGVLGGAAQILVTVSLRYAPASLLAPFDYATLVWSTLIGALVLGEKLPGPTVMIGAVIVAAAGAFATWRERVRARQDRLRAREEALLQSATPARQAG